jgi:hypothetical protein
MARKWILTLVGALILMMLMLVAEGQCSASAKARPFYKRASISIWCWSHWSGYKEYSETVTGVVYAFVGGWVICSVRSNSTAYAEASPGHTEGYIAYFGDAGADKNGDTPFGLIDTTSLEFEQVASGLAQLTLKGEMSVSPNSLAEIIVDVTQNADTTDIVFYGVASLDGTTGQLSVTGFDSSFFNYTSVGDTSVVTFDFTHPDSIPFTGSYDDVEFGLTLDAHPLTPFAVVTIEKGHDIYQGHYAYTSITIEGETVDIGGFDFLIAYDASALTFMEATPGQLLEDCGWEYFTYRYGWQGNCEGPCPSGLLRIIAIADLNNGPCHPNCFGPPDMEPYELAEMKFYVTNDRTYECMYVPIRFFWDDCGDNAISSVTGDTLFISDHVYDFEGSEVTGDIHYGGHWWLGDCQNSDPDKPDAIPTVNFIHGGIDIICSDSIDAPGDVNLNDIANEIADAVLFTNYFIYGLSVFNINPDGQIAATDVNNDSRVLTVGDLVYLIRIITGDELAVPKLSPYAQSATVNVLVNHSAVAISSNSEADIGAGHFVFEHSGYEIGEPHLINGASDMTLKYNDDDGVLKVLVYSMEKDIKVTSGIENIFVIPISGSGTIELEETELSDYYGNLLTITKDEQPILPKTFALHQNYPNPFNATTRIIYKLPKTSHVKIEIFNVMGQHVTTLIDRDESAGVHTVEWDALDQLGYREEDGTTEVITFRTNRRATRG